MGRNARHLRIGTPKSPSYQRPFCLPDATMAAAGHPEIASGPSSGLDVTGFPGRFGVTRTKRLPNPVADARQCSAKRTVDPVPTEHVPALHGAEYVEAAVTSGEPLGRIAHRTCPPSMAIAISMKEV